MGNSTEWADWYYTDAALPTPMSETHEMLMYGRREDVNLRIARKKLLNFQSFHLKDFVKEKRNGPKVLELYSTYHRDFSRAKPNICGPPTSTRYENPDFMFHRIPVSEVPYSAVTEFKFMDDHFWNTSESRKKANFFRQLKNTHYPIES